MPRPYMWRWDLPDSVRVTQIQITDDNGYLIFRKGKHRYIFTFEDPSTVQKMNPASPDWDWGD